MDRLRPVVQPYAWGSRTVLAGMQRRAVPSDGPEAELWMGAHPKAPAGLDRGGVATSLLDVVAVDPAGELGADVVAAHGPRLPFLLKLLAADQPLSLQAHPDEARARAGHAEEDARGVAPDAPERNYADPHHKPELLCALTEFEALCGFRDVSATVRLLERLECRPLEPLLDVLRTRPSGEALRSVFTTAMTMPVDARAALMDAVLVSCARLAGEHPAYDWAARLGALHRGDAGVVVSLLLNQLRLAPGEAVHLPAGNLHAYLHGAGIEVMASSDNVLRGGLTSKHVDVAELTAVLRFEDGPVRPVPVEVVGPGMVVYRTPVREFELLRAAVDDAVRPVVLPPAGPQVLFCTEGTVRAAHVDPVRAEHVDPVDPDDSGGTLDLRSGESAFVPAGRRPVGLTGHGTVFRASPAPAH